MLFKASINKDMDNRYVDTRGNEASPVPFTQAVINGLADGGGLTVRRMSTGHSASTFPKTRSTSA